MKPLQIAANVKMESMNNFANSSQNEDEEHETLAKSDKSEDEEHEQLCK